MKFHVGPETYTLVISDRAVFNSEGDEVGAIAVEDRRLLILSYRIELERREELARHEMVHCWEFHIPPATTAEQRSQFFALVGKQFDIDFENAGGNDELKRMKPMRVPSVGTPSPRRLSSDTREGFGLPDRIPCICGSDVMCGSINNSDPVMHAATQRWTIGRWAECEACGGLLAWGEVCTPDGIPLGQLVANPPPRVLRGRDAAAWLAGHAPSLLRTA